MQMQLIHETINDALREVIQAAGGYKKVGAMMFPDIPADHAAGKVRDCLNSERRERLYAGAGDDDRAHRPSGRVARADDIHGARVGLCRPGAGRAGR